MSNSHNTFDAWCSQHSCHPKDCWPEHNPLHEEVVRLKRNAISLCEHNNPVDECVMCRHERLQIETYGSRGDGPKADCDDGIANSDATEVSGTREETTTSTGGQ